MVINGYSNHGHGRSTINLDSHWDLHKNMGFPSAMFDCRRVRSTPLKKEKVWIYFCLGLSDVLCFFSKIPWCPNMFSVKIAQTCGGVLYFWTNPHSIFLIACPIISHNMHVYLWFWPLYPQYKKVSFRKGQFSIVLVGFHFSKYHIVGELSHACAWKRLEVNFRANLFEPLKTKTIPSHGTSWLIHFTNIGYHNPQQLR